jgi:RNA polymerase sigma-70 factor, ECF subfamily
MDWEMILKRDGPPAWRAAYRILGNSADTDECFQEAVMNALEIAKKGTVGNWRALLQRLITARAIDRLRQRYRLRSRIADGANLDDLPGTPCDPSRGIDEAELQSQLRIALIQIPANQAQAFCLCCLEGWTYRECGDQLSLTSQAVGVLIQRARKKLQTLLAAQFELLTTKTK